MNFTINQLMIMLAVKAGKGEAVTSTLIISTVKNAWGSRLAPSNLHVSAKKLVAAKLLKATRFKGAGRGTVKYHLTSAGENRLTKAMAGFDTIRA